jgi:hypothetical protein
MNIQPGSNEALSNHAEEQTIQNNSKTIADFVCNQDAAAYYSKFISKGGIKPQRCYIPLKTIGNVNYVCRTKKSATYPWAAYGKVASSTKNGSEIEEQKSLPDKPKDSSVNERIFESSDGKTLHKPSPNIDDISNDIIEIFKDNILMKQKSKGKLIKNDTAWVKPKPKRRVQKNLANRSDVVNKTLLRSLKRYYTKKFKEATDYRAAGKCCTNKEMYDMLTEFTRQIYENNKNFELKEFAEVTLEDLTFYMGIWINPMLMRKFSYTHQERTKFHNFYNWLYAYSHIKLYKLFKSNELYFMFIKFFEDGPFEELLASDETLKRNPNIYKKASEHFMDLFKNNHSSIIHIS